LNKNKFSKEEARERWTRWFIATMTPVSVTEHAETRQMMRFFKPEFEVPSRRTLVRDINSVYEKAKVDLTTLLSEVKIVATTADSWTSHNRAFLGMTVHWISPDSLRREHATLACKELNDRQTHHLLGQTISDILQEFGLANSKVAAVTTDNGSNYVSAFNHFAEEVLEVMPVDAEEDFEDQDADPEVINVGDDLQQEQELDQILLPPHHRC
jgi:hypothetical protein